MRMGVGINWSFHFLRRPILSFFEEFTDNCFCIETTPRPETRKVLTQPTMVEKDDSLQNPLEPEEAVRLKGLAEEKYIAGDLSSALKYAKRASRRNPSLDGISELLTAFRIVRTSSKNVFLTPADGTLLSTSTSTTPSPPPDYYKILQVERFAHINTIKKQYKKLALTLHPDKNSFVGSEEAFKHVGEAFRVLSDRIRRKEYDMKVRIAMQSEAAAGVGELETFWTACTTCRLLHKYERRYVGHSLMCPSCKKSFKAVEIDEGSDKEEDNDQENEKLEQSERIGTRVSERIRARRGGKMSSVGEILKRSISNEKGVRNVSEDNGAVKSLEKDLEDNNGVKQRFGSSGGGVVEGLRSRSRRKEESSCGEEVTRTRPKKTKVVEEDTMTLAQMQMLAKKVVEEKMKLKGKEKGKEHEKEKKKDTDTVGEMEKEIDDESEEMENGEELKMDKRRENTRKDMDMGIVNGRETRQRRRVMKTDLVEDFGMRGSKSIRDVDKSLMDVVAVEELVFYDFDKNRRERSFKKGQVWATYDSKDGKPWHYALIDEVVSTNPFEVELSWLEFQGNGDEQLVSLEKMGLHIPCGRFKIAEKKSVTSLKMFSHKADFERVARQVYWIYPKKGSVWALHSANALSTEGRVLKEGFCYDIVVFLTSFCKIHGMSIACLEKVDGFKTVFKRREIGSHAIKWLAKDDFRLFSHQIPAKKLSGEEATGLPKDCWELDPSSLPPLHPPTVSLGR